MKPGEKISEQQYDNAPAIPLEDGTEIISLSLEAKQVGVNLGAAKVIINGDAKDLINLISQAMLSDSTIFDLFLISAYTAVSQRENG